MTAGYSEDEGSSEVSSELIDLCGCTDCGTCIQPVDAPMANIDGITLRTPEGNPLICGGDRLDRECYEYQPETNSWVQGPSTIGNREGSATVEVSEGKFWILSGMTDAYTSEIYENGEFSTGPNLPIVGDNAYPCAAKVNESTIFYGNDNAYLMRGLTGLFTDISAGQPYDFYETSCGCVTRSDGTRIIVAAGGFNRYSAGYYSSSYIYDLEIGQWIEGPELPYAMSWGKVIPTDTSFYIVGGYSYSDGTNRFYDRILEFDADNFAWVTREERMDIGRARGFMIDVDKNMFCN